MKNNQPTMYKLGIIIAFTIFLAWTNAIAYFILSQFLPDLLAANLAGLIAGGLATWASIVFLVMLENQRS